MGIFAQVYRPTAAMVYESEIQFTLDTICPWTYLAKRRLDRALEQIPSDAPVRFSVKYLPYQLYPEASQAGEGKYEWYKKSKYGGTVANTLQAHRLIQHFQEVKGVEAADKIVKSLYRQYFEEEKHPSSSDTLLRAA